MVSLLLADRGDDVAGGQAARRHLGRIEPRAHRILAFTADDDVGDAWKARQFILHTQRGIVGHVERIVTIAGGAHMHDHQDVGRGLVRHNAYALHLLRQSGQRARDAVLHLNLRDIGIGSLLEGNRDRHAPVGRRLRTHVEHVLDAVDRLFERRGDGFGYDLRAGSRIGGRDLHRWRRDRGILAQGKLKQGDAPGDQHEHR